MQSKMHYWVRGLCRVLTRRYAVESLLLVLYPVMLVSGNGCCNDGWCNNGAGCCNNNGLPFVSPNGSISGLCPPGIFDGGFVNGLTNNGVFPGGIPNNRQPGGDFIGQEQFPQFPQNGRIPFGPPQFPVPNQQGNIPGLPPAFPLPNQQENIPGPPPQDRRGSFVGPPPPYPQQPVGPLRPQIDNSGFDPRTNNGYGDGNNGPLLPKRPTVTSTGNTNTGITFAGRGEDAGIKHPFENHRRRRRRTLPMRRFRRSFTLQ